MLTLIEKLMAQLAICSANTAAGTASAWFAYQPKEPKSIKKDK